MRRGITGGAAVVAAAAAAVSVTAGLTARADEPPALPGPAAEQVLLPAPDPAAPTARGVFVRDPEGQILDLAAAGHLVGWTVRTPAAPLIADDGDRRFTMPTGSAVIVADERGGPALRIDYPGMGISDIKMLAAGPGGPAAPQLAVVSCSSAKASSCRAELLTLTPAAPVSVVERTTGTLADVAEWTSGGKRLIIKRRTNPARAASCKAPVRLADMATGKTRRLPDVPLRDEDHPRCRGVSTGWIAGRFALIEVLRLDPEYSIDADYVYALDLTAKGKQRRWRLIDQTGSYTDGSGANWSIGPAINGETLYWERVDSESTSAYRLTRWQLPAALLPGAAGRRGRSAGEPVSPDGANPCAIAATDDAIYELSNPRCAVVTTDDSAPSEIRRVANPAFKTGER